MEKFKHSDLTEKDYKYTDVVRNAKRYEAMVDDLATNFEEYGEDAVRMAIASSSFTWPKWGGHVRSRAKGREGLDFSGPTMRPYEAAVMADVMRAREERS